MKDWLNDSAFADVSSPAKHEQHFDSYALKMRYWRRFCRCSTIRRSRIAVHVKTCTATTQPRDLNKRTHSDFKANVPSSGNISARCARTSSGFPYFKQREQNWHVSKRMRLGRRAELLFSGYILRPCNRKSVPLDPKIIS